jgi:hypothetical protein
MRRTILAALVASACPLWATPVKIHGYITSISSPGKFDIDDYRIIRNESVVFDLDKGDYADAVFRPEDLRVGTELEVQGDFNDATHELNAASVKVFANDNLRVKRTAVVEHSTALQRDGYGWTGTVHADGQTIRIDGQTKFSLKEDQTNQLTPGLAIAYEGRRERDGSITATRFEIFPNSARRGDQKLFEGVTPKLNSNGEISVHGSKYKLAPDAEAQSYVQRIGAKLVPGFYQQDLSGGAAHRLTFQFFLIDNTDFNAHAFPNGLVLVNSGVFHVLSTEAQFAAVLGHEIAHATQQHAAGEMHQKRLGGVFPLGKGHAAGATGDLMGDGYTRSLENQADRLSLEYMIAAGYDPREAPAVWKQEALVTQDDSLARRSYLLAELRNSYAGTDFQQYVRDREEFDVLARRFGNTAVAMQTPKPPVVESGLVRPGMQTPRAAQSPAAPGNNMNSVTVSSDPAGADVLFGGKVIGKTPLTIPTGNVGMPFILTVRKTGYRDWNGQLVSVPGKTNFRVELIAGQ